MEPSLLEQLRARAREFGMFEHARIVHIASAPGRLDVMGGIADYSGSLVLQLPLAPRATALAAPRRDDVLRVVSLSADATAVREGTFSMSSLYLFAERGYSGVRKWLLATDDFDWLGYVIGILPVFSIENDKVASTGMDVLVTSDVPEGKGVSSSAAVEVACAAAILSAAGFTGEGPWPPGALRGLALRCQRVENQLRGAPCGVMDQMTAACGREGALLRLLCQPAEVEGHIAVPEALMFWGIDSGVRHAVSGSDYRSVRVGAFMGFRILAELAGIEVQIVDGLARFAHPRWGPYLANVSPEEWSAYADRVPETMGGDEFLQRYGGISDAVTWVEPTRTYAVRQPTAHPILEHARVRAFADQLPRAHEDGVAERLGALMYESHASYSACGLGNAATDAIVAAVREAGPACWLFGAKITGGGSGGTVAVFGHPSAERIVQRIAGSRLVLRGNPTTARPVLVTEVVAW